MSKWAIDYEEAETEAFKLNHSEAVTITSNCNAILRLMFGHTYLFPSKLFEFFFDWQR